MKRTPLVLVTIGALLFGTGIASAQSHATLAATGSAASAVIQDDDDDDIDSTAWLGVGIFVAIVAAIYFVAEEDSFPTSP